MPSFERVFGARAAAEGAALAQRAPVDLRVNTLKATTEKVLKALARSAPVATRYAPDGVRIAAPQGAQEAAEAGRAWGRFLVEPVPPYRKLTARQSVERLTALLDDLGFDPEPEPEPPAAAAGAQDAQEPGPGRIRLRHCPFLELAEEYSGVVCPVHLGLMQGALAELRAPVSATRLEPFAEPGACVAHLAA